MHQDDQQIKKMSDLDSDEGIQAKFPGAQGPAVGSRGDNKLSPRTEKRGK